MNIFEEGAKLLTEKLNLGGDLSETTAALKKLFNINDASANLSQIVGELLKNHNLQQLIPVWLSGENKEDFNPVDLMNAFGTEKINEFATTIGVKSQDAVKALTTVLPQMLNKAIGGGNLLETAFSEFGDLLNKGKDLFK